MAESKRPGEKYAASTIFDKFTKDEDTLESRYIKSGILSWDLITRGRGIPLGRLIQLYSIAGLGKTTSLAAVSKSLCGKGVKILWVGVEPSDEILTDMGLIGPNALFSEDLFKYLPKVCFYNDLQDVSDAFMKSDYQIMIIDSITALSPSPETLKATRIEDAVVGLDARISGFYLKLYHLALKKDGNKSIIYISQMRNKDFMKRGQDGPQAAGGEASKFYADIRISMKGEQNLSGDEVGGTGNAKQARRSMYYAEKNRHANPFVNIPVYVIFGKGVSNKETLKEYLQWKGFIVQSGSYFTLSINGKEEKVQGKVGVYNWIGENYNMLVEMFEKESEDYFKYLMSLMGRSSAPAEVE